MLSPPEIYLVWWNGYDGISNRDELDIELFFGKVAIGRGVTGFANLQKNVNAIPDRSIVLVQFARENYEGRILVGSKEPYKSYDEYQNFVASIQNKQIELVIVPFLIGVGEDNKTDNPEPGCLVF